MTLTQRIERIERKLGIPTTKEGILAREEFLKLEEANRERIVQEAAEEKEAFMKHQKMCEKAMEEGELK